MFEPAKLNAQPGFDAGNQSHPGRRARAVRPALVVALAGALLTAPTLALGTSFFDDSAQRRLIGAHLAGQRADPWYDLFTWVAGDREQGKIERQIGVRPWWSADDVRVRFLRPLAAATHYVDYIVWPEATWAMHLQSMLWYALACAMAMVLCLRFEARRAVALLGGTLYALDDSHVRLVAWLAQRNALMGAALSFAVLHLSFGPTLVRPARASLAALCFLAALASSEGSLAILAYPVAYAIVHRPTEVTPMLRKLVPMVLVAAVWFIAYQRLGYGARGSGAYLSPLTEVAYWYRLPSRVAALLVYHVEFPPALLRWLIPVESLPLAHLITTAALAALVLAGLVAGFRRSTAFWALAALLSLMPAAVAEPHPRLLGFAGPALAMLTAHALVGLWEFGRKRALPARMGGLLAAPLAAAQLVLAPLSLLGDSARFEADPAAMAAQLPALGPAPELATQHLVVLYTPSLINAAAIPEARRRRGWSVPAMLTVLAPAKGSVTCRRFDGGFELRGGGLLDDPLARLWRGPSRPMQAGQHITMSSYDAEVVSVTDDGRPRIVRFRSTIGANLDSPHLRYLAWRGNGYEPIALPKPGASIAFP